jgi:hypothetical protein
MPPACSLVAPGQTNTSTGNLGVGGESGQGATHIDEIAPLPAHVFKSYVVDVEAHGACHAHEEVLMGHAGHPGVPAGQDL